MNPHNLERLGRDDVILAGYPGSGAAWIGCLLVRLGLFYIDGYHELLRDDHTPAADALPVDRRKRMPTLEARDANNPVYREPVRIIKTHLGPAQVGDRHGGKVILLVRDGRDALLSYYHWLRNFADLTKNLGEFVARGSDAEPVPPAQAWAGYCAGWQQAMPDDRLHVVRFEDLRADPAGGVRQLLAFLGVARNDAEIGAAIDACSFSAMRRQEEQAVAADGAAGGMIMRRGEVGEWRHALSPDLLRRIHAQAGKTLAAFGYEVPEPASAPDSAITGPWSGFDRQGSQLVFLIGLPRSGTTLVQRVLGSHPAIHSTAEPWLMLHQLYALRWGGIEAEYNAGLAREALRDFLDELPAGEDTYLQGVREMAAVLYGQALAGSGKRYFLDKTPRYHYIVGDLKRTFPKAKFVFLLRNPLAVLSSVLHSWFGGSPDALKAAPDHYRDLYQGWRNILVGIEQAGAQGLVVAYEDLVVRPEETVGRLCRHLELEFDPAMLEYGRQAPYRGQFGDQIGAPRRERPTGESLAKWKQTLVAPGVYQTAGQYLDMLGDEVLARLGYDRAALAGELQEALEAEIRSGASDPALLPPGTREHLAGEACDEGERLAGEGRLEEASDRLANAVRIEPAMGRALNDMGALLWYAGEHETALAYFQRAVAVAPADRTAMLNYADALQALGMPGSVRNVFMAYLAACPDDQEVFAHFLAMDDQAADTPPPPPAVTPEQFEQFVYSRRSHFARLGLPPEHAGEDIDACNLKIYQDMLTYRFILDSFPPGARLLEVGGGDSRIIRWLKDRYEFWNLDKLEGAGNGLLDIGDTSGFRLVRDYIGAFSSELPDGHFDGVFSLSVLEHVPEDDTTFANIAADIDRLLKPGGLSMHSFDALQKRHGHWCHGLYPYLLRTQPLCHRAVPFWAMRVDPDLWGMSEKGYQRLWQPITKVPYRDFGMPFACNVLWRKPLP